MHNRAWVALHALLVLGFFFGLKGCGGSEFGSVEADAGAPGGAAGSGGAGGSSGAAGSGGSGAVVPCAGPEDCNDQSDCTIDGCSLDGTCTNTSACQSGEQCCPGADGGCGQCCADADCDDKNDCTQDSCSGGACANIPKDTACGAAEYCSPTAGCVPRESCGSDKDCDDQNPCTTDACGASGCGHDFCEMGKVCCASGCQECCTNSQCDDGDPCTQDVCDGTGKCTHSPKCADTTGVGLLCCPGGSCGECCNASDCDDGIPCTNDKCVGGTCSSTPNDLLCQGDQNCDEVQGCIDRIECQTPADCTQPPTPCATPKCSDNRCSYSACDAGKRCCAAQGQCKQCCGDGDCNDNDPCTIDECNQGVCGSRPKCANGTKCCNGECRACCTDTDCPLTGGSTGCVHPACTSGVCGVTTGCLPPAEICCNGLSCQAVCASD